MDWYDAVVAVKDRLLQENDLAEDEAQIVSDLIGLDLGSPLAEQDTGALESGIRRYAGMLLTTPQYLLAGVPSPDQDPAADPAIVVPGTEIQALCNEHAARTLDPALWTYQCTTDGIDLSAL